MPELETRDNIDGVGDAGVFMGSSRGGGDAGAKDGFSRLVMRSSSIGDAGARSSIRKDCIGSSWSIGDAGISILVVSSGSSSIVSDAGMSMLRVSTLSSSVDEGSAGILDEGATSGVGGAGVSTMAILRP